jgi:hypothetical protein
VIRPLRRRHRWIWATLAALLPVLYWAALAARPVRVPPQELPAALASELD